ncbi:YhbY family RNA-binding protein [Bifidobacterium callimiconis]|uniref:RNA-binding protein n=1 Tax=Bifidobacterium callimiconis TaxID=2306973 RepID=A0A430FHS2_9BIFI|nr:YhbY family RNA-binding protein [Bifidobacterium callimiconis]MBT1176459.1 YhbY family RNA-binding protein [Bifidobacterium callimiconis]RSX52399.1 RNA-binding protein [Bifidobacterium callimiconis]
MALTKKQIKQLRAMGQQLNPELIVGKNGITDASIAQADECLESHELIKCTLLEGCGYTAKEAGELFAERLHADLVQVIGHRFVLYRRSNKDGVKNIRLVRE